MGQLRQVIETIRAAYDKLQPTHKLLAASLATVLAMTLFLVQAYSESPDMVPLIDASYTAEESAAAVRYLTINNIKHETSPEGTIMVAAGDAHRAVRGMSETGDLPGDSSLLFRNLLGQSSWTQTSGDKSRAYQLALQNELGIILGGWDNIRSAQVLLNLPDNRPIGRPASAPSASVNVMPAGGFTQRNADAVAALVAGASKGLSLERVRITDASTGRQFRPAVEDDFTASNTQELIAAIERKQHEKIYSLLSASIPGVVVAVNAQVDATRKTSSRNAALNDGQGSVSLLAEQQRVNNEQSGATQGGNPGARANTGASIATGAAQGASTKESNTTASFESMIGTERVQVMDPRGFATKINAVVNIPRTYFAQVWRMEQMRIAAADDTIDPPSEDADPSDNQIASVRDAELARIRAEVARLIDTSTYDNAELGDVSVSMIPLAPMMFAAGDTQQAGFMGIGGSGPDSMTVGGAIRTLGLGGLAVLALGLVVFTALKANKTEDLPSAEELVGIPPALEADDEIIGEAEGIDPPMEGLELSDAEMNQQRMTEQVTEMMREKPKEAATLVSRWISQAD